MCLPWGIRGTALTTFLNWRDSPPLDFRSQRFAVDALALVRLTGKPLDVCRQELFIAEGDACEACMVLLGDMLRAPGGAGLH